MANDEKLIIEEHRIDISQNDTNMKTQIQQIRQHEYTNPKMTLERIYKHLQKTRIETPVTGSVVAHWAQSCLKL